MGDGAVGNRAITMLYVDDVGASRDFYRDIVGLELTLDAGGYCEFAWGNLVLGLRARANARSQYGEVVAPAGAGASHQVTVEVSNVDALVARLAAAGVVALQPPTTQSWGMRSASFRDPDGHVWEVGAPAG